MDTYPGYREPAPARSPTERTSWGGRDDSHRDRGVDRDTFYRGRSPGMSMFFLSLVRRTQLGALPVAAFCFFLAALQSNAELLANLLPLLTKLLTLVLYRCRPTSVPRYS